MNARRALLATPLAAAARAQEATRFDRPLTIVVPFPPGGATDVIARLCAAPAAEALGVPVVIENRAGAGGTTGAATVARARPDGTTLLMGTIATHGIGPSLYVSLPYDAVRDFAPITQAASQAYALVVHPTVPARTVAELVTLAKLRRQGFDFGSAGSGTAAHLFMEAFRERAGIALTHVPYRGAGPQLAAVLAGEAPVTMDVVLTTLAHIRDGKLRALAVTSAARSPVLPDVPTLAEAGYPGYAAVGWNGLFAPAATPAPVLGRLAEVFRAALQRPEVRARIEDQGAAVVASTPEQFAGFVAAEIARWRDVVRATGARVE